MASGSFSNNVAQNCHLEIYWSSTKADGGSTVSATLRAQNGNAHFNDGGSGYAFCTSYGIKINGNQKTGSYATLSRNNYGYSDFISHSVWVSYTGNKSITISGYADFKSANAIWSLTDQTISGTADLDMVGYAPEMGAVTTPSKCVVAENTTSITVKWNKATSYNNSCTYSVGCSVNGGAYNWIAVPNSNINTTSYTWDITPNAGDTYQFAVCCANNVSQSGKQYSGVVTINKLEPPSIGDLNLFNPYINNTLNVPLSGGSQLNGEGFTRRANIHVDGSYKYPGTAPSSNNNSSVNITVNADNISTDLGNNSYSNSNRFSVVAWCENSRGTRSSYVSKTFTVNLNSDGMATPTLAPPAISGGALGYSNTCFIAGVSTINVSSPAATLRRAPSGTTISYSISCTDKNTQYTQNAKFSDLKSGVKHIYVTATDSRGLSTTIHIQCEIQPYSPPTINKYTATRQDNPQTNVDLKYTLSYSPIYKGSMTLQLNYGTVKDGLLTLSNANNYSDNTLNLNASDIVLNIKADGDQINNISAQQYTINDKDWVDCKNETTSTGMDTDIIYTVQLRIADKVQPSYYITSMQKVPTIRTVFAIRKWGIGINCVPQSNHALEVRGDGYITGTLSKEGVSSNWIKGRDAALIRTDTIKGYSPCVSVKTSAGSWEIGAYDSTAYKDQLIFTLASDDNYNGSTNKTSAQFVMKSGVPTNNTLLTLNSAFPVGSIYMTATNKNPGTFLGGTWEQFGQGRTLMGQGSNSGQSFTEGSTGGSYTHNHQYRLRTGDAWGTVADVRTVDESGTVRTGSKSTTESATARSGSDYSTRSMSWYDIDGYTWNSSTLPPYITVYFWKRTA